jgi:hypothetical protein
VNEAFEKLFPFRSKSDKHILRTRAYDAYCVLGKEEFIKVIEHIPAASYVHALNIIYGRIIWGWDWFVDAMKVPFDETRRLSDNLKTRSPHEDSFKFMDMSGFGGYRQLPYPGFDEYEEAVKLANGGREFRPPVVRAMMLDALKHLRNVSVKNRPAFITLPEFVRRPELWSTSGSSSLGRVVFEVAGKKKTFKARKNWILDLYSLDELVEMVERGGEKQVNTTVVKSELGKVRLAVGGDVITYLYHSYLMYLCGHFYENWVGVTLNETPEEELQRIIKTLKELKTSYAIPFDYKAFDHQMWTDEIVDMVGVLVDKVISQYPEQEFYISQIWNKVRGAFYNSVLVTSDRKEIPVVGGLLSGLRVTSYVGNAFNFWMFNTIHDFITKYLIPLNEYNTFKGDDTSIVVEEEAYGALLVELLQSFGADTDLGKFGLHFGRTEFLRVWYYSNTARGIANRVLPGLTQRKPWSNEPYFKHMTIVNIGSLIQILERRTDKDLDYLFKGLARSWSQLYKIPIRALYTPTSLGGLGVRLSPGEWIRVTQRKISSIEWINPKNAERPRIIRDYFLEHYGVDLKPRDIVTEWNKQRNSKVDSENIPRAEKFIAHEQVKTRKVGVIRGINMMFRGVEIGKPSLYGSERHLVDDVRNRLWLRDLGYQVSLPVVPRLFGLPRHFALDYLSGKWNFYNPSHPLISKSIKDIVLYTLERRHFYGLRDVGTIELVAYYLSQEVRKLAPFVEYEKILRY